MCAIATIWKSGEDSVQLLQYGRVGWILCNCYNMDEWGGFCAIATIWKSGVDSVQLLHLTLSTTITFERATYVNTEYTAINNCVGNSPMTQ
jgi:hypothetical protein